MANSVFIWPGNITFPGNVTFGSLVSIGSESNYLATNGLEIYSDVTPLVIYSRSAAGAELYVNSDTAFRAPIASLYRSKGTKSAPTAIANGNDLGYLNWGGYSGTAYRDASTIRTRATENWDSTHGGNNWQLSITPNTTTTEANIIGCYTNSTTTNTPAVGLYTNTAPASVLGLPAGESVSWSSAGFLANVSDGVWKFTNNATTGYGSLQIGAGVFIGFLSGSRSTRSTLQSATGAVTLSGATSATTNIIPAGATVESVSTTTTTAITGATGYTVGDGSDADRYGDITGTALGTNSGSANYTADPRWWTNAARAITLTAKTSNFTAGVVQVTVWYWNAVGA